LGLGTTGLAATAATTAVEVGLTGSGKSQAAGSTASRAIVREYWIQADSFKHNLVATGVDDMMGTKYPAKGATFWALGFRAYTPGWGELLPASAAIGLNTGIPGPIIRANVGDTVLVHFRNNDSHYKWPHSMHTHGFEYNPASDGGYVQSQHTVPGRAIPYGGTYTYRWVAKPSSAGTWPYHDHSLAQGLTKDGPVMELSAELGLFGIVAIDDAHTRKVDREFFLFFHDLYGDDVPTLSQDYDCFNGQSYLGNTPTFTARVGDKVRWRIAALGKEFHVFHIHGHRWKNASGRYVDAEILGPSTTLTVEYTEDNPGDWIYHCHVTDHMAGGMVGYYTVT
jgi:FtsP/CotA-like multicopper oxidase with cupredoxin domain